MVKFRCLLSNNIFEFNTDFDIETMREHPQYEEIEEEQEETVEQKPKKTRKTKEAK